jgi:hypothetical protein
MIKNYYENNTRVLSRPNYIKQALIMIFILMAIIIFSSFSFAAEKASKYQVVVGNDEKAYLLDTTTGFTWILTYRTMATGREPVAIPYKFIKISPVNQKDFIVENVQGLSLPPNGN